MSDIYLTIDDQPDSIIEAIATSMDMRAADPDMRAICEAYMRRLPSPAGDVVEIGCGNGATSALILDVLEPRSLTGIDPSGGLLDRARQRFAARTECRFAQGDAGASGLPDGSADTVIIHTVMSHLDDPEGALAEAFRLLRPGGTLAVFDGDYATNTVALAADDPLQRAMVAVERNLIHAPYVMRTMPSMMTGAGFADPGLLAHGYARHGEAPYLRSLVTRGLDAALSTGELGEEETMALKAELDRRMADGTFYGAILFLSVTARRPG